MKAIYESPRAALALFLCPDLLMASVEGGGNGGGNENPGGGIIEDDDGVIHLPPVPIG